MGKSSGDTGCLEYDDLLENEKVISWFLKIAIAFNPEGDESYGGFEKNRIIKILIV